MRKMFSFLPFLSAFSGAGASDGAGFTQISPMKAKSMMDEDHIIVLDVREANEYNEGHIPDATLFPLRTINKASVEEVIPSKDSVVLLYCCSGARSRQAAKRLVKLGYTHVYDFGGLNDWPYAVIKD